MLHRELTMTPTPTQAAILTTALQHPQPFIASPAQLAPAPFAEASSPRA
jgi:hypothetical protein